MRGWLVVNPYYGSESLSRGYRMLLSAAERRDVGLDMVNSADLMMQVGQKHDNLPDFALFWDKDVFLARELEAAGLRLYNSAAAIERCDDKALTALALSEARIPSPESMLAPMTYEGLGLGDMGFVEAAGRALGWPLVIKECRGSLGKQVHLARDGAEARGIIALLGARRFLMQRFVPESAGVDVRVNVVGSRVAGAMLRRGPEGDFRSNIALGGGGTAYEPDSEQKKAALRAAEAVGADFAGVDLLLGARGPLVCEVNSNPQFAGFFAATGIDLADEILAMITGR